MTGLLLPRRYADQLAAKRAATAPSVPANKVGGYETPIKHALDTDDFLEPEQVAEQVEQFTKYTGPVPRPVGWRVAVLVLTVPDTTAGGLIMVDDHRDARALASPQGVVIAVGDSAYADPARFPNKQAWVNVGDRVLFQKYGGRMFQLRTGQHVAFLNDTEFTGVVDTGWLEPKGDVA